MGALVAALRGNKPASVKCWLSGGGDETEELFMEVPMQGWDDESHPIKGNSKYTADTIERESLNEQQKLAQQFENIFMQLLKP